MSGWNRIKIALIHSRTFLVLGILIVGCVPEVQAEFSDFGLESTASPGDHPLQLTRPVEEGDQEAEPQTIERVSGEDKGPRIPEPMVFDLVRPLGARKGEWEVNVLALIPLRRKTGTINEVTDPSGLVRRSPDKQGVEWAPEIELVLADGIAIEFELPMEDSTLEAYKAAGQLTFGTAFNNRFIHGAQTIVQYNIDSKLWETSLLYLAGFRFDTTWSILGMFGSRGFTNGAPGGSDVELLSNVTLFADLTERLVAGIETNLNQVIGGDTAFLLMPQLHYEVSQHWMIQAGGGAQFTSEFILPQLGFRLIREF
jgi:hypothetical protein